MVFTNSFLLNYSSFFSAIFISFQAFLFFCALSISGFAFLPNPKNFGYSLVFERAVEGMFIFSTFSWFCWKNGFHLFIPSYFFWFTVVSLFLIRFLSNFRSILNFWHYSKKSFLIYILMAFIVSLIWTPFKTSLSTDIMTRSGGDLFAWSLVANHLFGVSDLSSITGSIGLLNIINDCFGVYSIVGLPSLLGELPIENITLLLITQCTLLGCLIYAILRTCFGLQIIISFFVALLFLTNSLWVYICHNAFISQIISTVVLFYSLLIASKYITEIRFKFIVLSTYFFLIICLFLIMYPALAPTHSFAVLFFLMVSLLINDLIKNERLTLIVKSQILLLLSFTLGLICSIIIFHDLFLHAYHRSFEASKAKAGWPFSLVDAPTLIGISNPYKGFYGTFFSSPFGYTVIILVIIALGCLFYNHQKNNHPYSIVSEYHSRWAVQLTGYAFHILALLAYLLIYQLLGVSYQQWKFASYYPLVFSIFTLGIFSSVFSSVLNFELIFLKTGSSTKKMLPSLSLAFLFSLLIFNNYYGITKNSMLVLSKDIENIASVNKIPSIETVYLDLEPYYETMAAMNYISQKKIVPISLSYIPGNQLKLDQVTSKSPVLTNQIGCIKIPHVDWSEIIKDKIILITKIPGFPFSRKISFSSTNKCKYSSDFIKLIKGYGSSESWGTWSTATSAVMRVDFDRLNTLNNNNKDIIIKLGLSAFIVPQKVDLQILVAKINNSIETWNFNSYGPHFINLTIPKEILTNQEGFLDITFFFPNATRPKDVDDKTTDPRQLAIGFLNAEIL